MKATMRRTAKTAHTRPTAARRVARPRASGVLARDTGDVLEPAWPAPLSALLTGGDLDADAMRAWDSGDEAVGGSASTPDQDIVDDIGRALGVEQDPDAEVWTSREILRERDRYRWQQEG
jgi:hypothetical protein